MKIFRLSIATGLALIALVAMTLALNGWHPAPVKAEAISQAPVAPTAPAAPLTLPPPWFSDDVVVDAPYDNPRAPTVDGYLSPGEYAGAGKVTFPGYGGYYHDVEVFFKHDAITLYVAFELPDRVNHVPVPNLSLFVDTNNDGGSDPQPDDFRFQVWRNGVGSEWQGTGAGWNSNPSITWTWGLTETMSGWSVEFGIPFSKLGISAGTFKELGLALYNGGLTPEYYWPVGASAADPATWGSLVSSSGDASIVPSGWDTFYWKPGPWEDYAPSGMPDFDQNQDAWDAYDGPAAVANSLWWFDSKFETPDHAPPLISDTYRLVRAYGDWDDHHYSNTVPFIEDLAQTYFGTNQGVSGTHPVSMFHGIHSYLYQQGLWDDYNVTMVISPTFDWVADEVMRSEDVILLMGLYEAHYSGTEVISWTRVGGHYVNVAGVDPAGFVAFSDPLVDYAEQRWRPGRVLSGTLIQPHPSGHYTPTLHNDGGNVSHDVYTVTKTDSPGGVWGPEMYGYYPAGGGIWIWDETFFGLFGVNPNPFIDMEWYMGGEIQTEVEFAIAVSPYTWKSSGEWIPEGDDPVMGAWRPWDDYAPNGVPDFDQKQDCWGTMPCPPIPPAKYTFCGPVAAANSLWWFDSKFEPNPIPPPVYSDTYPMVQSYDPAGVWDDHDPLNVDDLNTPWPGPGILPQPVPPGLGEFVEDLATYFQTDVAGNGTQISLMYIGIDQYLIDKGLRQGYVITMAESPDFWWVAEEVEVSEDVVLLLGFWEETAPGEYQRVGGHYVTVPGADKQSGLVAFSDPWYDGAEYAWPYAYPGGWPTAMGRVADGWLIPHPPYHSHVSTVHNDAGNISHDIYYVSATDSPGGVWGPSGYIEDGFLEPNFLEQNGDFVSYGGGPVQAEVDYALAVSPVADVWIKKSVEPDTVFPGDWVTFTINYGNAGNLAANVVISDLLPTGLISASVVGTWNSYGGVITTYDTFTLSVGSIPWDGWGNGHGIITVTARVDPDYDWPMETVLTNTAEISTTTQEQYQIDEITNTARVTFTVVQSPEWDKVVDGTAWYAGISVVTETTGTFTVVDVVTSALPFTLTEEWDADHLMVTTYTVDPPIGLSSVISGPGRLVWSNTGGAVVTLTKEFYVKPCTWTQTILTETLGAMGQTWQKTVTIHKQMPDLHIAADAETTEVFPRQQINFTLRYSNTGAYENDVEVRSILPATVAFNDADPFPDDGATVPDGRTALAWDIGDLASGASGSIVVTATVTDTVQPSDTLVISGTIHDHVDVLQDTTLLTLHVRPPEAEWIKEVSVNGVPTDTTDAITVWPSDTVQVVDRVWVTYTVPVTFTLVETWTESLELTGTVEVSGGLTLMGPNQVIWGAAGVTPNTWYVLTKTFHVTGTNWIFDYVTETLTVEGADPQPDDRVLTFRHGGLCWPVSIVDLTSDSPVYVGEPMHFTATVDGDPPITYTWDFDGTGTQGGTDTHPSFTYDLTGTYTVTLDVENTCPSTDTDSIQVTVLPIITHTLTVATDGGGSGTVTPPVGSHSYLSGTTVWLTATADTGSAFAGWSGAATGTINPISVTMDSDKTITATFDLLTYTLVITAVGPGTTDPAPGTYTYTHGASVVITATADPSAHFLGWSGDLTGNANPETILMDGHKSVTASFTTETVYTLTVATDGTGSGSVVPPVGTHGYVSGTTAWLTATAASGSAFMGWSGAVTGITNPVSLLMDSDKAITATFDITGCVVVSGANFTFAPADPIVGDVVTFTGTVQAGDPPITYTWDFNDGSSVQEGNPITHTFPLTAAEVTYTVHMTASNNCPSHDTASDQVTVLPRRIFLPLVTRSYP